MCIVLIFRATNCYCIEHPHRKEELTFKHAYMHARMYARPGKHNIYASWQNGCKKPKNTSYQNDCDEFQFASFLRSVILDIVTYSSISEKCCLDVDVIYFIVICLLFYFPESFVYISVWRVKLFGNVQTYGIFEPYFYCYHYY